MKTVYQPHFDMGVLLEKVKGGIIFHVVRKKFFGAINIAFTHVFNKLFR